MLETDRNGVNVMPLGKSVQIDTQLFLALYNYFFDDDNAPQDYEADEIRRKLQEKVDKLIDREIFTRYKRASTPQEREEYRQRYLDRKGISKSFRTDVEQKNT